jgi:hypothetical protein
MLKTVRTERTKINMISANLLNDIIGRPVKDIYGRYVGCAIGTSVDVSGQVRSIGVDEGSGVFAEYPNSNVIIDESSLVVIPEWKVNAEKLGKEFNTMKRRIDALEAMVAEGAIPKHVYDELSKQYTGLGGEYQDLHQVTAQQMNERIAELDKHRVVLEKFLGSIKVQHRTGEIDETTYQSAKDRVETLLQCDKSERDDIISTLRHLTLPNQGESHAEAPQIEAR